MESEKLKLELITEKELFELKSNMAKLRIYFDTVEELRYRGFTYKTQLDVLHEKGINLSLSAFYKGIERIRKERNRGKILGVDSWDRSYYQNSRVPKNSAVQRN